MPRIDVRFDLNEFKRELDEKGRKRVDKAAATALGRVATTVRKDASISIREKLAIKAAVAKKAITIRKTGDRLTVFIQAEGKPIPLRDYGAKQGKRGVTFRVSKSGERKVYDSKYGKGFIVSRIAGNVFVRSAQRPARGSAPIRKVYGPSIPQYFVTKVIRQLMEATARRRWPIEFAAAWRAINLRTGTA